MASSTYVLYLGYNIMDFHTLNELQEKCGGKQKSHGTRKKQVRPHKSLKLAPLKLHLQAYKGIKKATRPKR